MPTISITGRAASRGDSVAAAVAAVRDGRMVIVVDAENPDDDGHLVIAAVHTTPERVAFMVRHTGGILCVPMPPAELDRLRLPPMVAAGANPLGIAHAVSVNARSGVGSGVSAADRTRTIRLLADPTTTAGDLSRPGHVFPLRAVDGGVLRRAGHAEAAVDLTRLAGLAPVAVAGEVIADDGSVLRGHHLRAFAEMHALPVLAMSDLIRHRRRTERLVEFKAASRLPTRHGDFTAHGFRSVLDGHEHIALVMGDVERDDLPPLVRVHSECPTGDVFDSAGCDCSTQLHEAMRLVADEGRGVVLYLRTQGGPGPGSGRGLRGLRGCHLQRPDGHPDAVPVDARDYGVGAQILADLGVRRMRLLTNNPVKRIGLQAYGIQVAATVPLAAAPTSRNLAYLRADGPAETTSCG